MQEILNFIVFFLKKHVRNQIKSELVSVSGVCYMNKDKYLQVRLSVGLIMQNSPPEVLLGKGVLKICSKLTGEHPCRSVISIKLQSNFIEITL